MKCNSCSTDIDPKWRHAIEQNSCPFCGDVILPEELKNLFTTLSTVLNIATATYSEQLEDWLLSNYEFIKTTSPKLAQLAPKRHASGNEKLALEDQEERIEIINGQEVKIKPLLSQERANVFAKRSGAMKKNGGSFSSADRIKKLKQEIEKGGNPEMSIVDADPSAAEEYLAAINAGESQELIRPSFGGSGGFDGEDEPIPQVALALAGKFGGNAQSNYKDMETLARLRKRAEDNEAKFKDPENTDRVSFQFGK